MNFIKDKKTGKPSGLLIIMIAISVILFAASGFLSAKAFKKSDAIAKASYEATKEQTIDDIYKGIYDLSFENAEERTHVTNRVAINIIGAAEIAKLEVLNVYESVPVVENAEDNPMKMTSWEEATGTAVFTVDMTAAEFLVDNERQFVTVRIPKPEISELSVLKMDNLFLMNNFTDDSVAEGVDLAQKQRDKANAALRDAIRRNEKYEKSAMENAESLIKELIYTLNPDAGELKVSIEWAE